MMRKIVSAAAAAVIASTLALFAANTTFVTSIGDLVIPISPPNQATGAPGAIDNMNIGATTAAPARVTTLSATDQVSSAAGVPTIGSGACGAAANGTIAGTNQSGLITIGAAATTVCTVAFSKTLGVVPNSVSLTPANAGAAATGTTVARISSITATGFVITGSALASSNYYYLVF